MKFPIVLLVLAAVFCAGLGGPGCSRKDGPPAVSSSRTASPSPGIVEKDRNGKTPEMVCTDYFEAFRNRDMEGLKKCTTSEAFRDAQDGINHNPDYLGTRNYKFVSTTPVKDGASVSVEGEIQHEGNWIQSRGEVHVVMEKGEWKVVAGRWAVPPRKKGKAEESPGTH